MMLAVPLVLAGQQQTQQKQDVPDAPMPSQGQSLSDLTSKVTPGQGARQEPQTEPTPPPPPQPTAAEQRQQQQETPQIPAPDQVNRSLLTLHQDVTFISVPTTVLDKNHVEVAGLTWREFQVYENGTRQRIAFFSADPVPLSVALVIDQSLPSDTMRKVNDSLGALQGAYTPSDEIAVFTYGDGVNNPTDFTAAQSARLPAVLQASKRSGTDLGVPVNSGPLANSGPIINGQPVDPNLETQRGNNGFIVIPKEVHTLNDAILAAGKSLSTRGRDRRRIIYVISDGKESRSKASFGEVRRYLQANHIAVYGTLVGDSATWGLGYLDKLKIPLLPLSADNILPKYADATGGQLYSEFSANGIQRSFAQLAVLARTQYTLGYYSHIPLVDSRFRTLDVRVLRPNLTVIAPPGYYPTASMQAH